MTFARIAIAAVVVTAFNVAAHAQEGKTREQVRAELIAAQRDGDVVTSGESGLTLRELNPSRYPARAPFMAKTRAQVISELEEARRNGDLLDGDSGLTEYEARPGNFPQREVTQSKTREQVRAELEQAIRSGDIIANGDSGESERDLHPQRYATADAAARRQAHAGRYAAHHS